MKQAINHLVSQPFIAATSVAALVHSTWSLGTLFSGKQPDGLSFEVVGWLLPAFLIALSFDIGQVVTSHEIRQGNKSLAKRLTFVVFSLATYYLQWLYIAHHMPLLTLSAGVRAEWAGAAQLMRDAAIWVIPALLPLSTLLYTFSHGDSPIASPDAHADKAPQSVDVSLSMPPETPVIMEVSQMALPEGVQPTVVTTETFTAACPDCDWVKHEYPSASQAKAGLLSHRRHKHPVTAAIAIEAE
jgi:hypothetical protein